MAGRPNIRIKKLTGTLIEALSSGQRDTAALAYAEIRRVAAEAGMQMPDLPPEANELWLQVTQSTPPRDPVQQQVETRLSDITREKLLQAGDLAVDHMLSLMQADGLFGPHGLVPIDRQLPILNLVMGRSFGAMPLGAQRVSTPPGSLEPEKSEANISSTLSMLIRQKQTPADPSASARDITPEDGEDAA